MVRFAQALIGDRARAEEIAQDAFADLVARWAAIRDHGAAGAYLHTCVANGARSDLRHRAVVNRQPPAEEVPAPSAEAEALARIEREQLLAVLSALPARQREVLTLRFYRQLSEAEIAAALGISRGAVKTHNSRALRSLRATMTTR